MTPSCEAFLSVIASHLGNALLGFLGVADPELRDEKKF
jgi:hypothetical protein